MRLISSLSLVAMIATAGWTAPVPKEKEKAKPKDEEVILGTWRTKSMDVGDGAVPVPDGFQKLHYVFGDKSAMTMTRDGKAMLEATFKLDPEAKPKALDMNRKDGQQVLCLYELDGDSLKLCLTQKPGAPRPAEMKGDANTVTIVFVMERVKDEKKDK
jgi:uncharacterized protein (TIGR03067 family)